MFRCSMHRARTAEIRTLVIDGYAESFLLNYALMLRQPDVARTLRERVRTWARRALKVYYCDPPPEVQSWRAAMSAVMFSGAGGQHADTLRKLLGPQGILSLLDPMPRPFPRRSWQGQAACMGHIIQQEARHGMISLNFRPLAQAAKRKADEALATLLGHSVRSASAAPSLAAPRT